MKNGIARQMRISALACAAWLACGVAPRAHAEVHLPNGEYRTTATDLKVKILGGTLTIDRTWQAINVNKGQFRWYMNPAWADLDLTLDDSDGSIQTIGRTGAVFAKQGDDLYVLKESDHAYFIQVQRDGSGVRTGLRWSDRLGNAIAYDANGKILSYNERNGVSVHFVRDATSGLISTITDGNTPAKTILTFSYNGSQVSAITDYSGRTVQYHYTGADLTEVVDVLGHSWTYAYSGGLLHTQTDPEQHTTTIDYQGNRVVKVTDPQTYATTYTYDYDRGTRQYQIKETSPEGKQTYSNYDADGKLIEQEIGNAGRTVSRLVKDSANVEISYDERGLPTRTEYDANRNPIKITYPDGSSSSATYDGAHSLPLTRTDELGVVTKYDYDANGNLTTLTEAVGLPEQRITTATYNGYGQRLTQTIKGATPAEDATTTWTYDDYGNVRTITDAENHTTTLAYDAIGNVTGRTDARGYFWQTLTNAQGWLTNQIDPLDHETIITYDTVGNRKTVTDPEHNTTTYMYTANNWLETTTDPLGGVTTRYYTKDGQLKDEIDANNVTISYGYDTDGRLSSITDGAGNVTTLGYGDAGSGLDGLLVSTTYPTYREEYKYSQKNQRTQITRLLAQPNGLPDERQVIESAYDAEGQKTSETDSRGKTTQSAYDALGRLKSVTDPSGGTTTYVYDTQNNLKALTDANDHKHLFTYDRVKGIKTEKRPIGQTLSYDYDEDASLISIDTQKGERRVYTYDDAGRRTGENQYAANMQIPSQTIAYTYDGRNQLTGYTQTGDTASSATYHYDSKGQKRDETVTYGTGTQAVTKTIHYAYELNGLKKTLTYPDGSEQTSTYDHNRLATISIKGNTLQYQDYQWRVPTKVTMPGATRSMTYDPLQRPTEIRSVSAAGAIIMDYRYQYDPAGNIIQRTTEDGDYLYSYDNLDRLTEATPPLSLQQNQGNPNGLPVEQYTYDPVHNRKTSAHQPGAWIYNENNELQAYGTGPSRQTYDYDANGNTTVQKTGDPAMPSATREYIYNAAERLSEIKDNGVTTASYLYDPMGRRFRKETNAGVTWFQYADEGLIAEYAETGVMTKTYGWKPSGLWGADPIWLADVSAVSWNINFYHNDHLGTSQRLTDLTGEITWRGISEAFGRTIELNAAELNPLRAAGQYMDSETQTVYNYFRDLDQRTSQYLEIDPLGTAGGSAYYAYGLRNPLLKIDNQGLCEEKITGSLFNESWCVNNIDVLFNTARRKDMESPLFVDIKGDIHLTLIYRCKSENNCSCGASHVKNWSTYLYADYLGITVPFEVPHYYIPSPNRFIAALRMLIFAHKIGEFEEKAKALLSIFAAGADKGAAQACKLGDKGPIRLGGSC